MANATASCLRFLLCLSLLLLQAQPYDYHSAKLSTLWTNNKESLNHTASFMDGTQVRNILLHGVNKDPFSGPTFACGFFCKGACDSFLFAIYIVQVNSGAGMVLPMNGGPQVVWSANRNSLVRESATVELTAVGDLVLKDAGGAVVWSTNTASKSVAGMNITESGNLVLFDAKNNLVWQSFDHPTDALVLGQSLREGQMLTSNTSETNWTQGQYSLTIDNGTLKALIDSSPPQIYYYSYRSIDLKNATFTNGRFEPFFLLGTTPFIQYIRLEYDGHLRTYQWVSAWQKLDDVLQLEDCAYPSFCGQYGICSNGKCYCPNNNTQYFKANDYLSSGPGCALVTPITCQSLNDHMLLPLKDVTYSEYMQGNPTSFRIDEEGCKQACQRNCSCKAALFQYWRNASDGVCFLPSTVYTMKDYQPAENHANWSIYIKVQNTTDSGHQANIGGILGIAFGVLAILFIVAGRNGQKLRVKKEKNKKETY